MIHVISLGAGVQSSTMALMAAHGEIEPMPECAIFADTGWEPKAVYLWLDQLEKKLPFPVYRVSNGNIREDLLRSSQRGTHAEDSRCISPPLFVINEDGSNGMVRRQCTQEYKLVPLRRKQRELLGLGRGQKAPEGVMTVWIGISLDEIQRAKPSTDRYAINRHPLIEMNMTRADCLKWVVGKGYPMPPRSACIGCPFHSDKEWLSLSEDEFEDACYVDDALRDGAGYGRHRDMRGEVYLHSSCKPLRQASFNILRDQVDMFNNECEGMCGL